jgi:hypothetical protein
MDGIPVDSPDDEIASLEICLHKSLREKAQLQVQLLELKDQLTSARERMIITDIQQTVITDLRRMHELEVFAYSPRGITMDENIERRDLMTRYKGMDTYVALLDMIDGWLKISTPT